MVTKIGLDLGYANITLSDVTSTIYREPSVALVDKVSRRISAVGNAAIMGESDTGASGMLVRPFKNGLLFDKAITAGIIENAVRAVNSADFVRCTFGVPSDILSKQERELSEMLSKAGVDECVFVNRAMAALVGAGYSPHISAIVVDALKPLNNTTIELHIAARLTECLTSERQAFRLRCLKHASHIC